MRSKFAWVLPALLSTLFLPGLASAQLGPIGGRGPQPPADTGRRSYHIKRRTISGVVKTIDPEKRTLVLTTSSKKDVAVDMYAGLIKAGKGGATLADLQPGDRLSIYGETDVHGGLRAMETQAPASRMSIKPLTKAEKRRQAEAAAAAAAAASGTGGMEEVKADETRPDAGDKKGKKEKKVRKAKRDKKKETARTAQPSEPTQPSEPAEKSP